MAWPRCTVIHACRWRSCSSGLSLLSVPMAVGCQTENVDLCSLAEPIPGEGTAFYSALGAELVGHGLEGGIVLVGRVGTACVGNHIAGRQQARQSVDVAVGIVAGELPV